MTIEKFNHIHDRALHRKGSETELNKWLPDNPVGSAEFLVQSSDRFLSEMTRCIFQAGFVYRVINQKWPGFEEAFWGFDPQKMRLLSPEQLENLGKDERIVRNMQKILSVPKNAQFILDIEKENASFADFVWHWPKDNLHELLALMKKQGARLGGMTGQRFLRNMGLDTYVLTGDVILCLQTAGVDIPNNPTSKTALKAIQNAFNEWQQQSGLPMSFISRIGACSVGDNYQLES